MGETHSKKKNLPGGVWSIAGVVAAILIIGAIFIAQTMQTNATPGKTAAVPQVTAPQHSVYNAELQPAPKADTVDVKLEIKETTVAIAKGVAYRAWTFNGTIPGPIVHVRQGQKVHFTLINNGTGLHSIDFHAAQTAWSVNYQSIGSGKTLSFDWKAEVPGAFIYHCGSNPVIEHIAHGMYGSIIVDPAKGYAPAREFVLNEGEFYVKKHPDGSYSNDLDKTLNGTPDYATFNGYTNQYLDHPLTAKLGQRVRFFVINSGPNHFSAFHLIGALFSDVYVDGNPANHMVGNQTITIPPGGGSVVELTIPNAGSYPILTHSLADANKGALGLLTITK
ncbi:hypothetical protein KDA_53980 [Dictyobacter alpinus]|uniref:Copper-containing nitrite reductase n=1 Tax=Dictyobacter alpinus TaxID=2014873 RepID=A0A402BEU5_9CHLR|nr:multicopper oxidase domain-containing protein [Dictyobacter alpinus]GCE29914.1 hypothetical protein KDA_53980 [Dictyobacter alpinus]